MPSKYGSLDRDLVQGKASGALIAAGLLVTVPAGEAWLVHGVSVRITTTATVGNRVVTVELLDAGGATVRFVVASGQNVAASLTTSINFAVGGYPVAAAGSSPLASVWDAWPVCVAEPGQIFRVTDQAGIDITDSAVVTVSAERERSD